MTPDRDLTSGVRAGLAVAHPGHELKLAHWIRRHSPTVFILTSGARNGVDRSRLDGSRRLAQRLGARPGALFGDHLDREVYGWILAGDVQRFEVLAETLAGSIVEADLDLIVTDGWQYYNVAHDLWHLVARTAAALASRRTGKPVTCLDFPVVPPGMAGRSPGATAWTARLTPPETQETLDLAAAFPAIAQDVDEVLAAGGQAFLETESLHHLRPVSELLPRPGDAPPYERVGELRIQAGRYDTVLTWGHAERIVSALTRLLGDDEARA